MDIFTSCFILKKHYFGTLFAIKQIMKKIIYLYTILFSLILCSQIKEHDSIPNITDEYFLIKDGDSLTIRLDEVYVLPKHKFKSRKDARYYYWFRKKVFKAYPYALLVSKRLDSLEVRLQKIKSKRKQKKYIKKIQEYVQEELTEQFKKMTRTEGRILIKLVHRQTGETVFDNIKELRSGWKAFWYNSTANVFKLSLKDKYEPSIKNEDYLIEDIIQRAYINEQLEFQKPKLVFNAIRIIENKKGEVNVDVYKQMFAKRKKRKKRN